MQFFPASLQNLSDQFARLPGIGGKTAQRLAFHVLEMPLEEAQAFADAILEAKRTVHTCPCCQNLTDQPLCPICADETRDHGTICVVAEPKDDRGHRHLFRRPDRDRLRLRYPRALPG